MGKAKAMKPAKNKLAQLGRDSNGKFAKGHAPVNNGKGGRPKKPDFRTIIANLPAKLKDIVLKCSETGQQITPDELYAFELMRKVGEGDMRAIDSLGDRLLGKPNQPHEIDYTERREWVGEIRSALTNGKAGQLSALVARIRCGSDVPESCYDGSDSLKG